MSVSKLLEFQKKVGVITRDATNPFFKSKYFDINKLLEEVKPVLNELGLVLLQPLENINGKPALRTMIIDAETEDVAISYIADSTIPLPENPDPQKMGSIITYYRRYAIQSMLGLQAEDDDGNMAATQDIKYNKVSSPVVQKESIAKILKSNSQMDLKTADDYKEACFNLTGIELKPENYQDILNLLNK